MPMQITKTLIDRASALCGSDNKLAEKLGVSKQLVSKWRTGTAWPNALAIGKMAEMTGVRTEEALLGRDFDELEETEEGRSILARMRAGFLVGAVAISTTLGANATETATTQNKVCLPVVDTLYIVLSAVRTFVSRIIGIGTRPQPVYQGAAAL